MKNTKKWIVVTGGLIISAVLVVMISKQFEKPPMEDVEIASPNSEKQDEVVNIPTTNDDIVVPPIKIPEIMTPTNNNGDDDGTEQSIQPDPVKKPEPTEEQLTDSSQKPNGEKVDPPITDEEKVEDKKPVETPPPTVDNTTPPVDNTPQGGDVNDKGETFLPGFGWIEYSGENQGTVVDGDGDINKQVGTMD